MRKSYFRNGNEENGDRVYHLQDCLLVFRQNLTNVSVTETTPYVFKSFVVHTRL
jgi:hypothetical protein